mgnify:CR=1 FL=1
MVQYGIPAGLSLRGAIQAIFNFYCSSKDNDKEGDVCMDGTSFVRMCRDAPDLGSAGRIQRYELDLIFSKAKPSGKRKLGFGEYLNALLELATNLYPDDDPTTAMTLLLINHIFGLFDQKAAPEDTDVFGQVFQELAE